MAEAEPNPLLPPDRQPQRRQEPLRAESFTAAPASPPAPAESKRSTAANAVLFGFMMLPVLALAFKDTAARQVELWRFHRASAAASSAPPRALVFPGEEAELAPLRETGGSMELVRGGRGMSMAEGAARPDLDGDLRPLGELSSAHERSVPRLEPRRAFDEPYRRYGQDEDRFVGGATMGRGSSAFMAAPGAKAEAGGEAAPRPQDRRVARRAEARGRSVSRIAQAPPPAGGAKPAPREPAAQVSAPSCRPGFWHNDRAQTCCPKEEYCRARDPEGTCRQF